MVTRCGKRFTIRRTRAKESSYVLASDGQKEYLAKVHTAVKQNLRYSQADVLGFPGSFLDQEIFPSCNSSKSILFCCVCAKIPTTSAVTP